MTNEETPEEFFNNIASMASLPRTDQSICFALSEGDGWWGNVLATDANYISPNGDLAADYHEFCRINSLDQNDVTNAEHFLKQFKLQQKISKLNEDFE